MKTKSYQELMTFETFEERLNYLYIGDKVGRETFGNSRWINQRLYKSYRWIKKRSSIIARDEGCDLGVDGCGLNSKNVIVHHINPITEQDIVNGNPCVFDDDNLITVSRATHNYIHYGTVIETMPIERSKNDTSPWLK